MSIEDVIHNTDPPTADLPCVESVYHQSGLSQIYESALYADLFYLKSRTAAEKEHALKIWYRDFIYTRYEIPNGHSSEVLFFRSLVRDDYKELFHTIVQASGTKNPIVIEDYKIPCDRVNLHASRFFTRHMFLLHQIEIEDALDRACCLVRLCQYLYILDLVRKCKFEVLVCFADMQPVEHLLSHFFRNQGKTTVTLQHGLYIDYGQLDTVNAINYLHQPSEHFLAWGSHTAELISSYHPGTNIEVCGKPSIFVEQGSSNGMDNEQGSSNSYVSIVLDQEIFRTQNDAMLSIVRRYAKKRALEVRVRFHPTNSGPAYMKRHPGIKEDPNFTDAIFVIGHTSSLIYEAITLRCKVFRFKSSIPAIELPRGQTFSSLKELEAIVDKPQDSKIAKRYISCFGDESKKLYNNFFKKISSHAA